MKTPIVDFVKKYNKKHSVRLHMPGHKGKRFLGVEKFDITEFAGADNLYEPNGIILESERNASEIFGSKTLYSTEGSSHCIRAMVYLIKKFAISKDETPLILAGRNCHKSFVNAVGNLGVNVEWLFGNNDQLYLCCNITKEQIELRLSSKNTKKPTAIYLTSPDYLGNTLDIESISCVCRKHGVLLIVDNAHGGYLRFLPKSRHPIDLGADMCCDSAHKTLSALTGSAYLHINNGSDLFFSVYAKEALSVNGSTSPSYLTMQSLDYLNRYLTNGYKEKLQKSIKAIEKLRESLKDFGYQIVGNEALKVTILTKSVGYTGCEIAEILYKNNIVVEAFDKDYVVMMMGDTRKKWQLKKIEKVLTSIKKKDKITRIPPKLSVPEKKYCLDKAIFMPSEKVSVEMALGKVFASSSLACPPAVPIVVCGEIIDESVVENMRYYGINECFVVKE